MKRMVAVLMASALAACAAVPAFADVYTYSDEFGDWSFGDDGSVGFYSPDTDTFAYTDANGNTTVIDEDGDVYTYNGSTSVTTPRRGSSSSSSSSNSRYQNSTVTDAYWSYSNGNLTAHWNADYRSSASYTVTLYRDGKSVTSRSSSGGSNINFSDVIASDNRTGDFYFTVKARWPGSYTDTMSSEYYYVDDARLQAIRNRNGSGATGISAVGSTSSTTTSSSSSGPSGVGTWEQVNGTWRYKKSNGVYASNGWETVNGKWYYFDGNGAMATSRWVQNTTDPRIWYYVGPNGDMQTNQYIGEYYVNANGEWYAY